MNLLSSKWRVFGITYSVYAVVYITRKSFSVVKTLIQEDLSLSTYALGTIDSVFLASYAVFQVFLPAVSDAIGIRPVLVCSLLSAAFFSLTFSLSYSPSALIISWFFEGISHAPIFSVLIKSVSLTFPLAERGQILGIWTTSQQVGAMLATTLVTFVSTTFGWRAAFNIAGLITLLAAIFVYQTLPEAPLVQRSELIPSGSFDGVEMLSVAEGRRKSSDEVTDDGKKNSINSANSVEDVEGSNNKEAGNPRHSDSPVTNNNLNFLMSFWDVLKIPNLVSCGISYFCVKLVRYALLFWLPFFLITEVQFETAEAGYSSLLFDIGGIFGAVASGFIADKLFHGKRLTTCAVLCVASSISLSLLAQASMKSESLVSLASLSSQIRGTSAVPESPSIGDLGFSSVLRHNQTRQTIPLKRMLKSFDFLGKPASSNQAPQDLKLASDHQHTKHRASSTSILVLVTLVGFFIAGPDSILGAASAGEICSRSKTVSVQSVLSTATGIVNGLGAFGGVAQGCLIALISEKWGWSAVFFVLSAASLVSVLALWRCVADDWNAPIIGERNTSRKNTKTIN